MFSLSQHTRAVLQAVLVTVLWATSWVLIKTGLNTIPSLTFAGLRYTLAWICLLPLTLRPPHLAALRALPRAGWLQLIGLGLIYYTVTQGAQFVALSRMPAITLNLMLSLSAGLVALLGVVLLAERLTLRQWSGLLVALSGAVVFFYRPGAASGAWAGYAAGLAALLANALSAVLGRHINRAGHLPPLAVTTVSMGVGAGLLLVTGLLVQGLPPLSLAAWGLIGWLAVVNTAFAFTLWNHTLRTLTAAESSILNNLLIIEIPILAWIFLGERLTPLQSAGLALAGAGAVLVQLRRSRAQAGPPPPN